MNKIFNPNNIFAFPLKAYDLQNVFFCKELLKERFFVFPRTTRVVFTDPQTHCGKLTK